jgi:NADP-dependent 3-hydroxy acid dehydrogenase YdfG
LRPPWHWPAAAIRARFDRVDLLVNNAGVMIPPHDVEVQRELWRCSERSTGVVYAI